MFQPEITEIRQWLAIMEGCHHFQRNGMDRRIAEIAWARAKITELEALELEFAHG